MPTIEERTAAFYAWERRGRGWSSYPTCVELEPPYLPYRWLGIETRAADDARRPTWLSAFVDSLGGRGEAQLPSEAPAFEEPVPGSFSWQGPVREFQVTLPPEAKVSDVATSRWLQSLATTTEPIAFEVVGQGRRVELRVSCGAGDARAVLGTLEAFFPSVVTVPAGDTLGSRWEGSPGTWVSILEFGLAREFMVPLAVPSTDPDPLTPFVGALGELEEGALSVLQILFEPTRAPWEESVARAVLTPSDKPFFADAPEITKLAAEKVASPLYAVALRIGVKADDGNKAWSTLCRVAGGLGQFGSPARNELIPLAADDLNALEVDLLARTTHRSGMLLSLLELASLVHLPGESLQVGALARVRTSTNRAPESVRKAEGVLLGENEHRAETVEIHLPLEARLRHMHVVGASGTGKSTLLVNLILQDIEQGHGVGVLDPHGDLIDEVLGRLPKERVDEVVLFDPAENEYVIGWNMLGAGSEVEKELLASDLVGVFRRLSTSWGDQMSAVLDTAILSFLESERGGTLVDLRQFLVDRAFRTKFLATVRDPHLVSFWTTEFPVLAGRKAQAPILTRLNTFLRSRMIRRVVTEERQQLDFRDLVDSGRIFLGKLAQGLIGEENASLLGSLLVSKFHQVTLMRQDQSPEERRPFLLHLDEVHHVATPSMAALFSGARKYRLGVTAAHQDMYQIHARVPEVERAMLANAHTRICFRAGEEDARSLARGFESFEAEDLMNLETGEAICRVGRRQDDFNLRTLMARELDPQEAQTRRELVRDRSREHWARQVDEREKEQFPSVEVEERVESKEDSSVEKPEPPRARSKSGTQAAPRPSPTPGRGGPEHKYLQELIKRWAQERGFKALIEHELPDGGRVDIALQRGEVRIACELAVASTVELETANVQKCLAAGFDAVAAVSLKKPFLRKLRSSLHEELTEAQLARVELYSPEEFLSYLASEPVEESQDSVAGYQVRVKYKATDAHEQKAKQKAVSQVLIKRLQKLKGKK